MNAMVNECKGATNVRCVRVVYIQYISLWLGFFTTEGFWKIQRADKKKKINKKHKNETKMNFIPLALYRELVRGG